MLMNRVFSNLKQYSFMFLGCTAALLCTSNQSIADGADDAKITIGSKAPDLDIEHWVSDGDGKFEHTTKLEEGKVYVIEFWATWCGPCISSMPHISETQDKYAEKGVQIISVSDETMEEVEAFLKKDVRGDDEKTYAELTSNYCLTVDPDSSVFDEYFRAAGQRGIPCAFIVGKTGVVEWIGHPMSMDKPLEQVVGDEWDRDAFMVKFQKAKADEEKMAKMQRKLSSTMQKVNQKMDDGETGDAVKLIQKVIENEDYEIAKPQLAQVLNSIAWTIFEEHDGGGEVKNKELKAATKAAEIAAKADPENGAILDTLAHLVHLNGDLDRAIEIQTKALEFAQGQEAEIRPFLKQLKAEKEKAGDKDKGKSDDK